VAITGMTTAWWRIHEAPPALDEVPATVESGLHVQAAWLAQRESAVGDWVAVAPPLERGDEVQLTVRAEEDAWIYVLSMPDGSDGSGPQVIFPPPGAPPSQNQLRAGWQYGVPAPHESWRLDGARHDRLVLIASRRPLPDPIAAVARVAGRTHRRDGAPLTLPLRDGRAGRAPIRLLDGDDAVADTYDAR
jgi:hypothetical protein